MKASRTYAAMAVAIVILASACASGPTMSVIRSENIAEIPVDFLFGWYDTARLPIPVSDYRVLGLDTSVPYTGSAERQAIKANVRAVSNAGMHIFLQIPRRILSADDLAVLDEFIDSFLDEPFYGWYLADEPELNRDLPKERLRHAANRIRAEDGRPLFIMHYRPTAIKEFAEFTDITGINYYPAFKWTLPFLYLGESFISRVRRAAAAASGVNKHFVMALQAYGRAPDGRDQFFRRLPTAKETAYMFWASLSVRPRGILFWARYRSDPRWVDEVLRPIVGSFRTVFPDQLDFWDVPNAPFDGALSLTGIQDADGVDDGVDDGARYILVVNHGFLTRTVDMGGFPGASPFRLPGLSGFSEIGESRIRLQGHSAVLFRVFTKE